jgi:hypothetical protein
MPRHIWSTSQAFSKLIGGRPIRPAAKNDGAVASLDQTMWGVACSGLRADGSRRTQGLITPRADDVPLADLESFESPLESEFCTLGHTTVEGGLVHEGMGNAGGLSDVSKGGGERI